jgi:hypothetical protein
MRFFNHAEITNFYKKKDLSKQVIIRFAPAKKYLIPQKYSPGTVRTLSPVFRGFIIKNNALQRTFLSAFT